MCVSPYFHRVVTVGPVLTHLLFKSGKSAFHINALFPAAESVMLCGNNISGACDGSDPALSSKGPFKYDIRTERGLSEFHRA